MWLKKENRLINLSHFYSIEINDYSGNEEPRIEVTLFNVNFNSIYEIPREFKTYPEAWYYAEKLIKIISEECFGSLESLDV